jgi:hypothetical protein
MKAFYHYIYYYCMLEIFANHSSPSSTLCAGVVLWNFSRFIYIYIYIYSAIIENNLLYGIALKEKRANGTEGFKNDTLTDIL